MIGKGPTCGPGEALGVGLIRKKLPPGFGADGLGLPAGGGGGSDVDGGGAGGAAGAGGEGDGLLGAVGAAPGPNTP